MIDENDPRLACLSPELRRKVAKDSQDDAGCLIWHGPYCVKTPALYLPAAENPTGRRGYTTVRSKILREITPSLAGRKKLSPWVRCGDARCVLPEHVYAASRAVIVKPAVQAGYASNPSRRLAISKVRQSQSKLTWDDIEAMRASDEPQNVLAERYGICRSAVSSIKLRKIWKQRPGAANWADVFSRLVA